MRLKEEKNEKSKENEELSYNLTYTIKTNQPKLNS